MKILNLTHSPLWFDSHFTRLLSETGHTGETFHLSLSEFSAEKADEIWHRHKDYFNSFDAILVSHLASWCRPFLREEWTKPLFVWMFFRFDHDVPDQQVYYDQLREARNWPNVKFFAATEYDRAYAESKLGPFSMDIVLPFLHVDIGSKVPIPCGPDKFYLAGRHNEGLVREALQNLQIPFYQHDWWSSTPDLRTCRGVLHFPYVFATRSLIENISLENVYFLPSPKFLNELRRDIPSYFWDGGMPGESQGDYSLTEWYGSAYPDCFQYFDSFEHLKGISDNPDFDNLITEKKRTIREFKTRHLEKTRIQWKALLG